MFRRLLFPILSVSPLLVSSTRAQETTVVPLPPYVIVEPRVANTSPVGTFAMPVSQLRFEPLVDVQSRNLAEGQADVTVRGGIFENTGFRIGGASLFDPQTGHYFAEIPVSPEMLSTVRILTGVDNSVAGFNSSVATLQYGWSPIVPRGEISAGLGEYGFRTGALYNAFSLKGGEGLSVLADIASSYSEGDGSVPGGDHEFVRHAGRLQLRRAASQTDFFAGYQSKFFGWKNLYTPFGFLETENIKTALFVVNHRADQEAGAFVEFSALWRKNVDDYEFDRTRPGASNPFEHETRVFAASIEARQFVGEQTFIHGRAELVADSIVSTSLTAGRFRARTYFKGSLTAERAYIVSQAKWTVRGGMVFDHDNRVESQASPLLEIAWHSPDGATRVYAQVSGASQVPGYTAIGSSSTGGLFRGNQNLGREESSNWETGLATSTGDWKLQSAVFIRQDRGLVDWTFRQGVTARSANPVDIDTVGFEAIAIRNWARGRASFGYSWLDKDADYLGLVVDASFYALNFARHRATLSLVWQPIDRFEIRLDNEFRIQEPNFLRNGSDEAFISTVGFRIFPLKSREFEVSVLADNLWNDMFEEIPAVPASRRQISVISTYRW